MTKLDLGAIEERLRDGWETVNIRDDVLALVKEVKRKWALLSQWGRQAAKRRAKKANVLRMNKGQEHTE